MADHPTPGDGPTAPASEKDVVPPAPPTGVADEEEKAEEARSDPSSPDDKAAAAERRQGVDQQEEDDRGYDDLRRVHQLVNNNFYSGVDASGASFGFGSGASPGLAPGTIEPEEASRALRFYVPPQPCFDEALGKLHNGALVVLAGQHNCGRGAGSLALLRDILGTETKLRSLSPANALADLAMSRDLKAGQGYVVLDYVGEQQVDAVQAYAVKRLSEELSRKKSYLVITASSEIRQRLALQDYCVQWQAPNPTELFEHCREQLAPAAVTPETESELRQEVAEQQRPADIVTAAVVLSREGPERALETLRDRCRELVQELFRKKPPAEDLIPLAALAFLEGTPERTFEKECAALTTHVRSWEQTGEASVAEPEDESRAKASGSVAEQSRARWKERAEGLVTTQHRSEPGRNTGRSERCLVFTEPRAREFVIAELHDLYGYELWYPLRQWLGDLALLGDLDSRTEVARGVAVLARHALVDVDENMLKVWSDGVTSQRVTAALTLQFMCDDEHLAPQALGIALGWTDHSGPNRAVTAAMALTGRLGTLYHLEALNWLWFLTHRAERIASSAHRSLVLLLQTAEHDPERALTTLRYVRTMIVKARPGSRERSIALRTAVQLLEAARLETTDSVTSALLRTVPDSARHLGSLWAETLHSGNRSRALSALCQTLVQLRDDPSATDVVRELGEIMRNSMSARQWAALHHHMSIALRHPDYAVPGAHQLARVLLGSLRSQSSGGPGHPTAPLLRTTLFPSQQGGQSK
ncbi:hypothetical protein [Streptomyces sp. NPDC054784]